MNISNLEGDFINLNYDWFLILKISLIVGLAAIVYKSIDFIFKKLHKKESLHMRYIKNIIKGLIIVYSIGLIANLFPSTKRTLSVILASSGLIVAVLGFAAQESLSNIINGLFISVFRPFEIGDRVTLTGKNITGLIEDITLRHTVVKTITNTRLIIPNSIMNKEIIENSHYADTRAAMLFDIWVSYDSDIRLAIEIMSETIAAHPLVIDTRQNEDEKQIKVLVRELGESGICLRATVWTETVDDNFVACSDLRLLIKEEFDKNGIEIPYKYIKVVQ